MLGKINLNEDRIGKIFLFYALPGVFSSLAVSIYGIVDGIFVGRIVGSIGLAGVNLSMPVMSLALAMAALIGIGGNTFVCIELGRQNQEQARCYFTMVWKVLLIFAAAFFFAGLLFSRQIAGLLGADGLLQELSGQYLYVFGLGSAPFLFNAYLRVSLHATAKPNIVMIGSIAASIVNIVLDYIFIVRWGWGVQGAALGTVIGEAVAFCIYFPFFIGKDKVLHWVKSKVSFRLLGKMMYNGSSEAIAALSAGITTMVINFALLNYIGDIGVSAFSVVEYVAYILCATIIGISQGLGSLISYYYGSYCPAKIKKLLRLSCLTACIIGLVSALFVWFSGELLIRLFTTESAVIALAQEIANIYIIGFLVLGVNIIISAYFTAIEKALESALISFLRSCVFIIAGVNLLPLLLGPSGIWISIPLAEFLALTVALLLLRASLQTLDLKKPSI